MATKDLKRGISEEEDFDATLLTFEEWNEQFTDEGNLEEFIPEYGMTLREFRMGIYESERSGGITYEELGESIKKWKMNP